jgi:beclin 1
MANEKKQIGLACQKCRTPIDIDVSIDQLNPAAFKLLIGTVYLVETFAHHTDI